MVNTCGLLNAKEESVNTILEQIHKKEAGDIDQLFVTGCLSERYKTDLEREMLQVDAIMAHRFTSPAPSIGGRLQPRIVGRTPYNNSKALPQSFRGLQPSCSLCHPLDAWCKHRSHTYRRIKRAEKLAQNGVKELLLIAQDLTYYGLDIYGKRRLADLLKAIIKVEGIEWIRLHYAFPTGFPMDVIEIMKKESKICNYLDIPLQHISDPILKSMRRGTTQKKTTDLINNIQKILPEIAIRTTLIVGYPGETDDDFEILKQWIKEMKFERLGCFHTVMRKTQMPIN